MTCYNHFRKDRTDYIEAGATLMLEKIYNESFAQPFPVTAVNIDRRVQRTEKMTKTDHNPDALCVITD